MKKIFITLLTLLFVGSLLYLPAVFATEAEMAPQKVDYSLPYPGLLPDSPVYFVKVIRDQFVLLTLTNPEKKAFYSLLLADKRIAASQVLVNSGKGRVGMETALRAEEYLGRAIEISGKLPKDKRGDLVSKLVVATAKHKEVLDEFKGKVGSSDMSTWQKALDANAKAQNRVMEIYLQK